MSTLLHALVNLVLVIVVGKLLGDIHKMKMNAIKDNIVLTDLRLAVKNCSTAIFENGKELSNLFDLVGETNEIVQGMEIPNLKEIEKLYDKIKRDATDFKRRLTSQDKKITKFSGELEDRIDAIVDHASQCERAVESIRKDYLDELDEFRVESGKQFVVQSEKVIGMVRDIGRDFHVLAAKLTDGSIKEIKILSERDYLRMRKLDD